MSATLPFSSFLIQRPRFWLSACVALSGMINLVEGLLPKDPGVLLWMADFLPFEISEHSRMLLLGGGFLQLALSRGLFRGKKTAWALATGILFILPFLHLSRAWDWHHTLAQLGLAIALVYWRGEFRAKSDRPSVRWALVIGVASFVLLSAFGLIGIESVKGGISGERGVARDLQTVWELILLQGTETLTPTDPNAVVVFSIISKSALMLGFVTLTLILRPILPRGRQKAPPAVREIISKYGVDPLDEFAFLPDKRYFLDSESSAVVSYALWRNIAVTLGDPVGPSDSIGRMIRSFKRFCEEQDWTPVFYEVREEFLADYRECGFRIFKVAEDSRIDLSEFSLTGGKFQNLRTAQNKIKKSGLRFSWHKGASLDPLLHAQLQKISQEWLAAHHATEMTFDLGSFEPNSLQQADLCVLHETEGAPVAFTTWLPYDRGTGRALDLMRHSPSHRHVMEALIVESLQEFQRRGLREASLSNAPLANIDAQELDKIEERAIRSLFEKFNRYYGYKSLFSFKEKFHPQWKGRFVAYSRLSQIIPIVLAIVRVHLPGGLLKFLRS